MKWILLCYINILKYENFFSENDGHFVFNGVRRKENATNLNQREY